MLTPTDCHTKRNEHLALARKAEKADNYALGSWHRLFAANFELMASDDPVRRQRGMAMLKKNSDRFERDMVATQYHSGAGGA